MVLNRLLFRIFLLAESGFVYEQDQVSPGWTSPAALTAAKISAVCGCCPGRPVAGKQVAREAALICPVA